MVCKKKRKKSANYNMKEMIRIMSYSTCFIIMVSITGSHIVMLESVIMAHL